MPNASFTMRLGVRVEKYALSFAYITFENASPKGIKHYLETLTGPNTSNNVIYPLKVMNANLILRTVKAGFYFTTFALSAITANYMIVNLICTSLTASARDHIPILCTCLLYTSPSPRDATLSRMPSSA